MNTNEFLIKEDCSFKKELLWVLFALVLGYLINYFVFGKEALSFNQTIDINIYDTYFLIKNFGSICFFEAVLLFLIFLCRYVFFKGRNMWTGVWLLIATISLIIVFDFLVAVTDSFVSIEMNSLHINKEENIKNPLVELLTMWAILIKGVQLVLVMLLPFIAFRMGVLNPFRKATS